MHYYATETYRSISEVTNTSELWQLHVVQEALKYEYLLSGIFALTAFHKSTKSLHNAHGYFNIALHYQNSASSSLRGAIFDLNQENSGALFATSVIMYICVIASPSNPAQEPPTSFLDTMVLSIDLLPGLSSIAQTAKPWLQPAGPFRPLFEVWNRLDANLEDDDFRRALTRLRETNEEHVPQEQHDERAINARAIDSLESCFLRGKTGVLVFLVLVRKEFGLELKLRKPTALLILLYWGVLLDNLQGEWWAEGAGKGLIQEVSPILWDYGMTWRDAARWAIRRVGLKELNQESQIP